MKERIPQKKSDKPFLQSYWVLDGLLCAGCYPGDLDLRQRDVKLLGLVGCGIRRILCLMEASEQSYGGVPFVPNEPRLQELAAAVGTSIECLNFPIPDASVPDGSTMQQILNAIDYSVQRTVPTYLHCWGGHGRTGTVVACYLIRHGAAPQEALDKVVRFRKGLPKSHFPFEGDQKRFVLTWREDVKGDEPLASEVKANVKPPSA